MRSWGSTALGLLAVLPVFAQSGFVRVNQVGYEAGSAARAYLMSSLMAAGNAAGVGFTVSDADGNVAASGVVGSEVGVWGSFGVYAIDFMVPDAGTYRVTVGDPVDASSPVFAVDSAANLYSGPLANSVYFYQNQRDGPAFILTPLRSGPAHLNDENASVYAIPTFDKNGGFAGDLTAAGNTLDVSGGWMDAGDYLKFVETTSYTTALMLVGVRDFPDQSGTDYLAEARFGLDWLQKMWDDESVTLYLQVGIATGNNKTLGDHDIWRIPEVDDTYGGSDPRSRYIRNRPVFAAGPAGSPISPNLAGRLAAGFALCFQVFQQIDPDYAADCLVAGEHVFDLADTQPSTLTAMLTAMLTTTAPYSFYPETEWRDDLEFGAAELYLAVMQGSGSLPAGLPHCDPAYYLNAGAHWASAYIASPDAGDPLNLYDVSGLAHFELYRAMNLAGNPDGLEVAQADLVGDLQKQLDRAVALAGKDPFEFGFKWNGGDTVAHGAGLSVMAQEYAFLTGSEVYGQWGKRWLGNILGANAWGVSFIVGDGSTFPDCMQHQEANLVGSLDGTGEVLRGALVEGPNVSSSTGLVDGMKACPVDGVDRYAPFNVNRSVYRDNVQSYSTDEPAIDLTAPSFLAFAWAAAGGPAGP